MQRGTHELRGLAEEYVLRQDGGALPESIRVMGFATLDALEQFVLSAFPGGADAPLDCEELEMMFERLMLIEFKQVSPFPLLVLPPAPLFRSLLHFRPSNLRARFPLMRPYLPPFTPACLKSAPLRKGPKARLDAGSRAASLLLFRRLLARRPAASRPSGNSSLKL